MNNIMKNCIFFKEGTELFDWKIFDLRNPGRKEQNWHSG